MGAQGILRPHGIAALTKGSLTTTLEAALRGLDFLADLIVSWL